jgi:hypothetical protein
MLVLLPITMRAERAPAEQFGTGSLVRLHPREMDKYKLRPGEIVTITGNHTTILRVRFSYQKCNWSTPMPRLGAE